MNGSALLLAGLLVMHETAVAEIGQRLGGPSWQELAAKNCTLLWPGLPRYVRACMNQDRAARRRLRSMRSVKQRRAVAACMRQWPGAVGGTDYAAAALCVHDTLQRNRRAELKRR